VDRDDAEEMRIERRKENRCKYCGGMELRMESKGKIMKICLICGKDFEANRAGDLAEFNKLAREFNG
jgi:DNA-directed RNA polymerase subunit RPC12/RpoP